MSMANIRVPLVNNEYYHVFNRGIARMPVFLSKADYQQALLTLKFYQVVNPPMKLSRFKELPQEQRVAIWQTLSMMPKRVEIVTFTFMPNHFHFLLKQTHEKGISSFLSEFTNSYTRFFNIKYERSGPMYQGLFKAVRVESDEQLIHLSRYIHINAVVGLVILENELFSYPWSSLPYYCSDGRSFVNSESVLKFFSSIDDYKNFLVNHIDYAKELNNIKHLTFE
jgi:putative transposase